MPTNPLGKGTANQTVNVPASFARLLGREAAAHDMSISEFTKTLYLNYFSHTEGRHRTSDTHNIGVITKRRASELTQALIELSSCLLILLGLGALAALSLGIVINPEMPDLRRPRPTRTLRLNRTREGGLA